MQPVTANSSVSPRSKSGSWIGQHTFAITFVILALMNAAPFWVFPIQPMPDHGNHLAAVSILRHLHDAAWDFEKYYTRSIGIAPYWGFYGPTYLLSWLMSVATANRFVLSWCVVGLPLGMVLLARRLGRDPWLALFAFPLSWNYNLWVGFSSFTVGLAVLPFALVTFIDFCEKPTLRRGLLAAALGVVTYLCHLLPWGAYLGSAGLIGLCNRGLDWRALGKRVAVWLPSPLVAAAVMRWSHHVNMAKVKNGGWAFTFIPWPRRFSEFNNFVLGNCKGHEDEWLAAALLLTWFLLRISVRPTRPTLHELRGFACFLTAAVAYWCLPLMLVAPAEWYGINIRFAVIAMLFLALCVPGRITAWRRWLLVPVVLLSLGVSGDVTRHWGHVHHEMIADYEKLANLPEPGTRVMFVAHGKLPYGSRASFSHGPMHQALHGGYMPWNFDDNFPIRYRVRYPAVHFWAFQFDWNKHARYYDYLFTYQVAAAQVFGSHLSEMKMVAGAGRWVLWRLPGPREDQPPHPAYPKGWEYN